MIRSGLDYDIMKQIAYNIPPKQISVDEVREAVAAINRGKSEDIFGMSIESIYYAGEELIIFIHGLIQKIVDCKKIPDILRSSLLTPIYKNRLKNYRGIAVVSVLQRGFTENASPLNCAIIVDEVIREGKDSGKPVYMTVA